jgi:anhydro-N-acetylmuramic acid kinase
MRQMHPEGPGVDTDGVLAMHGQPDEAVVLQVLSAPFFKQRPPRSTDGPAIVDLFFAAVSDIGPREKLPNHLATASLISITAIVRAMREFLPHFPDEVIASGGGVKNRAMMNYLKAQLAHVPLRTSDELGVPGDAKEAVAFALLGAATLDNIPANVPAATGAKRRVVLGAVTPKP